MPKPLQVKLTPEERQELEELRNTAPQAYIRERATAIIKVADKQSVRQVAKTGLLKVRKRQTLSEWIHRYQAEGIEGLKIRKGRGRKPAFFPSISQ